MAGYPQEKDALIIGAGIGGLLAARVLADYFERVTLLERDDLPEGPEPRSGVPQGRHLHSLAARGSELLEGLFPGLDAELAAAGCPAVDQAQDTVTDLPTGRMPRFRSGIVMRAASRDIVEWSIRRRLAEDQRVRFLARREVTGLLREGGRITGVLTRGRGEASGAGGAVEKFEADLVVDASGQSSRAPRWLSQLGYEPPRETVVDARLGYASRWYRVPEGFDEYWGSLTVLPGWPDSPRGGSLRRVEGDRWTVVLVGIGGDYPPTDEEGFERFARSLPSPLISDAVEKAEPISPVYGYRRTANRRRRYEKTRLPENFLVLGDAAVFLNPSYGQGMTTAALSAQALGGALRARGPGRPGLARRFHKSQAKALSPSWTATTASDAQWSAEGLEDLGPARRFVHRLSVEVMRLAAEDEEVARTLLAVKNLLSPPRALLKPRILLPALKRALLEGRGAKPPRSAARARGSSSTHPRC